MVAKATEMVVIETEIGRDRNSDDHDLSAMVATETVRWS